MDTIQLWKRIGETPLEASRRIQDEYMKSQKVCYTGRLDPLAQGYMTILFDDEVHHAPSYNGKSKTYRFQAVLGIETDSYDVLGRITNHRQITALEAEAFMKKMTGLSGRMEQEIPACSAYRYKGQPLWQHAKNGTLPYPMPTKQIEIYSVSALQAHPTMLSVGAYRKDVLDDIADVTRPAGFAFGQIIEDWESQPEITLYRVCFDATVGSGTFIRSLVHDTAISLGIPAHAFRITRLRYD